LKKNYREQKDLTGHQLTGDRSVPDVPIVQPLRSVQCRAAVQGSIVQSSREDKPERELLRFWNSRNIEMSADLLTEERLK
jgi:hypothetical protein